MSAWTGRTALVTGARGFVGAAVARALRAAGARVHGASRASSTGDESCDRWWQADLTDLSQVRALLEGVRPEVVFHLAGLVAGAREIEMVLPMLQANLVAAVNLMVAATGGPVRRLVCAGSLEEPPAAEGEAVPGSPYAAAKLAAGHYLRMCHALYGTPAVSLRLFMVYGPGQPDERKLVPYATLSLLRGEAPALASGARPVDWVYVDDVVEALLAAGVAAGVEGRTLDVGSGRLVTVREVVERIARLVGGTAAPCFGAVPERPLERVRAADVAPASALLGWQPRTPLPEGLRRTVEWYRRRGEAKAATGRVPGEVR